MATRNHPNILGTLIKDTRTVLITYWKQILVSTTTVAIIFSLGFSLGRVTTPEIVITKNYYNNWEESRNSNSLFVIPIIKPIIPIIPIPLSIFNVTEVANEEEVVDPVVSTKPKHKKVNHKLVTGFKDKYIIQPKIFKPGMAPHRRYLDSIPIEIEINEEARCLALNIYFESRSEPLIGKYAVGLVTMGRVEHKNYPNTICGVVWQKGYVKRTKRYIPQFSWTLDGRSDKPKNKRQWQEAQDIAIYIYHKYPDLDMKELGLPADLLHATHYHARYVKPRWRHDFKEVAQIGLHLFYK